MSKKELRSEGWFGGRSGKDGFNLSSSWFTRNKAFLRMNLQVNQSLGFVIPGVN
jgi:hypothetical protein